MVLHGDYGACFAALSRGEHAPWLNATVPHRAVNPQARFQVVNVAHWASREALAAAQANPDFQAPLRARASSDPDLWSQAHPAVYEVVLAYPAAEQ